MPDARTITIPTCDLPTSSIVLVERGRKGNKYLTWESRGSWIQPDGTEGYDDGATHVINLTETEICEYAAKALKELTAAQEAAQRAQDRADALRMFARELYGSASLNVVGE